MKKARRVVSWPFGGTPALSSYPGVARILRRGTQGLNPQNKLLGMWRFDLKAEQALKGRAGLLLTCSEETGVWSNLTLPAYPFV